jgi:hypothetical protein
MSLVITAPHYTESSDSNLPRLFLGGGISNAKNWQPIVIKDLLSEKCIIYNPRRESFDLTDESVNHQQVEWEYKYLHESDILVFYFVSETVCPITLFELGAALERNVQSSAPQKIIVYCEEGYIRTFDVLKQVELINRDKRRVVVGGYGPLAVIAKSYDEFIQLIRLGVKGHLSGPTTPTSITEFERVKPTKTFDSILRLERMLLGDAPSELYNLPELKREVSNLKLHFLSGQ